VKNVLIIRDNLVKTESVLLLLEICMLLVLDLLKIVFYY